MTGVFCPIQYNAMLFFSQPKQSGIWKKGPSTSQKVLSVSMKLLLWWNENSTASLQYFLAAPLITLIHFSLISMQAWWKLNVPLSCQVTPTLPSTLSAHNSTLSFEWINKHKYVAIAISTYWSGSLAQAFVPVSWGALGLHDFHVFPPLRCLNHNWLNN